MAEVARSIRVGSTFFQVFEAVGYTLGGVIAAEGSFGITRRQQAFADGTPRLRFTFTLSMAVRDLALVTAARCAMGAGSIRVADSRNGRWLPEASLRIASEQVHLQNTIPFCERYLLRGAKRAQYETWRDHLLDYREQRPSRWGRGPSTCRIPDCDRPVRGRGLCRRHYYLETGW